MSGSVVRLVAAWLVGGACACSVAPRPSSPTSPREVVTAAQPESRAPRCELERRAPTRVDAAALTALRDLARETDTDALVVLEDGHVILELGEIDRRFELMSVTKSIVSLAVGILVDDGRLDLEQPVADFIPAWRGSPKEAILVRHVLEHSTGLEDERTTEKIYASPDFVELAIDTKAKSPPGTTFFYSNRAVNLLSRVVEVASGERLDVWAGRRLFAPLGISDFGWSRDKAGNPHAMSGLQMRPLDVAKLGQLVLDEGRWCDAQVVSRAFLETSTRTYHEPGFQPHGLLWWLNPESTRFGFSARLFAAWRASGVPEPFVSKLQSLEGRYFDRKDFHQAVFTALTGRVDKPTDAELAPYFEMTWKAGRPDADIELGPVRAIVADGYGGQTIAVYPRARIVLVRLRDVEDAEDAKEPKRFLPEAEAILFPRAGG